MVLDDAPAGGAADVVTSLWQNDLVAVRGVRMITWAKATPTCVSLIAPAAYVPGT